MTPVEWVCFLTASGYSQAAQDYVCALKGAYDVRMALLYPAPQCEAITPDRHVLLRSMLAKKTNRDALQVYHCTPQLQRRVRKLPYTVGFATFETHNPPPEWVTVLNGNDAVIAPSLFCKAEFERAGVKKPIFHIPHCLDMAAFNPNVVPMPLRSHERYADHFKFLFFGSWKLRKGWPQLLEAYWTEFSTSDRVVLVIKTDRVPEVEGDIARLKRELGLSKKDVAPVLVETRVFDEQRLPSFLKAHDCLVFPTLGEGFGLPPLQCMALGVPVIATNHSGCQDYLSYDTATLIEPKGYVTHQMLDRISQFRNRPWAFVPVRSIATAMRTVVGNVDEAKRKAGLAAVQVAERYSYAVTAAKFKTLADHVGAKG